MNPIEFVATPGDLAEGQALLTNKQEVWRRLPQSAELAYVKLALFETRYRQRNESVIRTFLNSPYTPSLAYDGACNLLEPA